MTTLVGFHFHDIEKCFVESTSPPPPQQQKKKTKKKNDTSYFFRTRDIIGIFLFFYFSNVTNVVITFRCNFIYLYIYILLITIDSCVISWYYGVCRENVPLQRLFPPQLLLGGARCWHKTCDAKNWSSNELLRTVVAAVHTAHLAEKWHL